VNRAGFEAGVDEDQGDQLIARVQQATADACERWLRHKATRGLVEPARQIVLERLWPQIEPVVSGDEYWPAAFAMATCGGVWRGDIRLGFPSRALSDGTIDRPVDSWLETLAQQDPSRAQRALDLVVEMAWVARDVAERLQRAGVPILPEEPSDRAPLVLLLLLNPEVLDWGALKELATRLTFFPGFAYLARGSAIIYSDRLNTRQRRDGDLLRQDFRARQADFTGASLRNRGGRPQGATGKRSLAATLAEVLPQVVARFPEVTAAEIRMGWRGSGNTAGRMLRDLMGKGPAVTCPSTRALQRALKKIRDQ